MGARLCGTPLTVGSTQEAVTQIAGDLGPNLSLFCRKMDGLDRDQEKGRRRGREGGRELWNGRYRGIRGIPPVVTTSALYHPAAHLVQKWCYVFICVCLEVAGWWARRNMACFTFLKTNTRGVPFNCTECKLLRLSPVSVV